MSRIPAPWLKSILLTIYPKPAITRDEIIRSTGLNPASVSQALQHLLSSGTVLKVGELKSRERGELGGQVSGRAQGKPGALGRNVGHCASR